MLNYDKMHEIVNDLIVKCENVCSFKFEKVLTNGYEDIKPDEKFVQAVKDVCKLEIEIDMGFVKNDDWLYTLDVTLGSIYYETGEKSVIDTCVYTIGEIEDNIVIMGHNRTIPLLCSLYDKVEKSDSVINRFKEFVVEAVGDITDIFLNEYLYSLIKNRLEENENVSE